MSAILFALISYFSWAIGDTFGVSAVRRLGPYSSIFWGSILSIFFFVVFIPFAPGSLNNATNIILLLNLFLGFLLWIGLIAFSEALIIENASLVGTIAAASVALTVIFSILFLKEDISLLQAFAIFIIFSGLILSTLDIKEVKKGKVFFSKGVMLAIVAMITWGIYLTFIKIPVKEMGWFWPNVISFSIFPFLTFFFMKIRKIKLYPPTYNNALIPEVLSTLLTRIAELNFNFAISKELTSVVAPIAGSYPTLFVVLVFIFFKDKITRQQILGIVITLIGIVLLSFLSV